MFLVLEGRGCGGVAAEHHQGQDQEHRVRLHRQMLSYCTIFYRFIWRETRISKRTSKLELRMLEVEIRIAYVGNGNWN